MVRSITKPKQMGGISHVKIPTTSESNKPTWETIYNPHKIKRLVLQQHHKHFSQANGTTFTINPLCNLINDECTSEYTQQILAGTANIDDLQVNKYTKALLNHLTTKVPPSENPQLPLDHEALIQGFKLWPERTSTSPSSRHLGIYKSLTKHFPLPKDKTNKNPQPKLLDPLQSSNHDVLN